MKKKLKTSTQGYKADSPDRFNPMNVIPSGNITMQNVPHPVYGMDNFGNAIMMYPGNDYEFPGNQVAEFPMKAGGQPCFECGGKMKMHQGGFVPTKSIQPTENLHEKDPEVISAIVGAIYGKKPISPIDVKGSKIKDGHHRYIGHMMTGKPFIPAEGMHMMPDGTMMADDQMKKGGKWIQDVAASIKRRGTEGVCTGDKFGSASCPPGSKRYNLAKTFKAMAKKQFGGTAGDAPQNTDTDDFLGYKKNMFTNYLSGNTMKAISQEAIGDGMMDLAGIMQMGGNFDPYAQAYENMSNQQQNDGLNFLGQTGNLVQSIYQNPSEMYLKTKTKWLDKGAKQEFKQQQRQFQNQFQEQDTPDPWAAMNERIQAAQNAGQPMTAQDIFFMMGGAKKFQTGGSVLPEDYYPVYPADATYVKPRYAVPNIPAIDYNQGVYNPGAQSPDGNTTIVNQQYQPNRSYPLSSQNAGTNTGQSVSNDQSPTTSQTVGSTQVRRGNYAEPSTPAVTTQQYMNTPQFYPSGNFQGMRISYPGAYNLFPGNFNRRSARTPMGPGIAYNPQSTYLDEYTYKGRMFGPGARKVKMKFSHYGRGPSGTKGAQQQLTGDPNEAVSLNPNSFWTAEQQNLMPENFVSADVPMSENYRQSLLADQPVPGEIDFMENPDLYPNMPSRKQKGGPMKYPGGMKTPKTPLPNVLSFFPAVFQMGGASAGENPYAETTAVWKRSGPGASRDWADWGIAGMSMLSSIGEKNEREELEKQMSARMSGDNVFQPIGFGDASRGSWTVNRGDFRPDDNTPVQFSGANMGMIGSPYQQFQMGGEYVLSDQEINTILQMGGEIEFID